VSKFVRIVELAGRNWISIGVTLLTLALALILIYSNVPPMIEWSSLVSAFAQLAEALQWPLVALILGLLFREQIGSIISRLKSIEGLGLKAEVHQTAEELSAHRSRQRP